jgi:hypothetical protein
MEELRLEILNPQGFMFKTGTSSVPMKGTAGKMRAARSLALPREETSNIERRILLR